MYLDSAPENTTRRGIEPPQRRRFGVRWQATGVPSAAAALGWSLRDTALDLLLADHNPKRRRRFALPAHSKFCP